MNGRNCCQSPEIIHRDLFREVGDTCQEYYPNGFQCSRCGVTTVLPYLAFFRSFFPILLLLLSLSPAPSLRLRLLHLPLNFGDGQRGHYKRDLLTEGISRIPKISTIPQFFKISRRWSDSPSYSTLWGSTISRISNISRFFGELGGILFREYCCGGQN